jgi:hypothetical protein
MDNDNNPPQGPANGPKTRSQRPGKVPFGKAPWAGKNFGRGTAHRGPKKPGPRAGAPCG